MGNPDGKPKTEQVGDTVTDFIPLRRQTRVEQAGDQKNIWFRTIEDVVQSSIQKLRKRTKNNLYLSGVRDLESTLFCQSLIDARENWENDHRDRDVPIELELFSNPVGLIGFQVHNRKYSCIKYPVSKEDNAKAVTPQYEAAIRALEKDFSSNQVDIKAIPTTEELTGILIDHLNEDLDKKEKEFLKIGKFVVGEMLRPRRSAIRDWQDRMEEFITAEHDHEDDDFFFYTYPIVDLLIRDGKYLVVLFISPLDKNFVDEKVTDYHQCAEITLGIFNVANKNYMRTLNTVDKHLQQAYGRVLFTNMHEEASQALTATFDDQSRILRYWVRMAAKGYDGLIKDELLKGIFDGKEFIRAVVNEVLCAEIEDVETEVYPFDRVFIFREAGSSSSMSITEPIEVTVMEASILSTNPADRNQFLTAPEMRLRTTQDFERDASRKVIKEQDVITYYLHSNKDRFIFTQKPTLTEEDLKVIESQRKFVSEDSSKYRFYRIIPPKDEGDSEISAVFSNLLGRLIDENFDEKRIISPKDGRELGKTQTFHEDFEKRRLEVTEKFDSNGLYYHYSHGVKLAEEIPLLQLLQTAYFYDLEEEFSIRNQHHVRDRYKQDNLDREKMREVLDAYKEAEEEKRRKRKVGEAITFEDENSNQTSKVIYISFSWELHDQNMELSRRMEEEEYSGVDNPESSNMDEDLSSQALLGEEYTYTMILVSDLDREKSLAQLNAERENMHLFFQMIMDRIWMDKKVELLKLKNRSKMIEESLAQFVHRAKNLLPADWDDEKEVLDSEMDKLKAFTNAKGTTARLIKIDEAPSFYGRLLKNSKEHALTSESVEIAVRTWLGAVSTSTGRDFSKVNLNIIENSLPTLRVRFSRSIVKEAFDNMLKNAAEAAHDLKGEDVDREVSIQLQAFPQFGNNKDRWFFDIVVENTGGPIPERMLRVLTSPTPAPLRKNDDKKGSNGLGVFLSRFQLINDIGSGADLIYTNLDKGRVQVRLRLPATLVRVQQEGSQFPFPESELEENYILYVEDVDKIYAPEIERLKAALAPTGLKLRHADNLERAAALVQAKLPAAIFTDYNIFPDENIAESRPKFGLELIIKILWEAKDQKKYPPIWVMTEEAESTVMNTLLDAGYDLGSFGYKKILGEVGDPIDCLEPGVFVIFSESKFPSQLDGFKLALESLAKRMMDQGSDSGVKAKRKRRLKVKNAMAFELSSAGMKTLEENYVQIARKERTTIFFAETEVRDPVELFNALRTWYAGPELHDPDLDEESNSRSRVRRNPHPIYSHPNHERILLVLEAAPEFYSKMPLAFIYWGMTQNFLVLPAGYGPGEAVEGWRRVIHDRKGPLSKLRHDAKNAFSEPKFGGSLARILKEIDHLDSLLLKPEFVNQNFECGFTEKDGSPDMVHEILVTDDENTELRHQIRRGANKIDLILGELKKEVGKPAKIAAENQVMIQYLTDFLGVK